METGWRKPPPSFLLCFLLGSWVVDGEDVWAVCRHWDVHRPCLNCLRLFHWLCRRWSCRRSPIFPWSRWSSTASRSRLMCPRPCCTSLGLRLQWDRSGCSGAIDLLGQRRWDTGIHLLVLENNLWCNIVPRIHRPRVVLLSASRCRLSLSLSLWECFHPRILPCFILGLR